MNAMSPNTEHPSAQGWADRTLIQCLADARAADMRETNEMDLSSEGESRSRILIERATLLERVILLTPAETPADVLTQVEMLALHVDSLQDFDHSREKTEALLHVMHAGCWSIMRLMERDGLTLRTSARYVDPWLTGPETKAAREG